MRRPGPAKPAGSSHTPLFPGDAAVDQAQAPDSTLRAQAGVQALDCWYYGTRGCSVAAPCAACEREPDRFGPARGADGLATSPLREKHLRDRATERAAAVAGRVKRERKQARADWRTLMLTARGDAAERARTVAHAAHVVGLPEQWAMAAALVAFALPGEVDGIHELDDNRRLGLAAAATWLESRRAPLAEAFRDYLRGLQHGAT